MSGCICKGVIGCKPYLVLILLLLLFSPPYLPILVSYFTFSFINDFHRQCSPSFSAIQLFIFISRWRTNSSVDKLAQKKVLVLVELEMNYNYCVGLNARSDIIFPAPLLETNCCRLVILPLNVMAK